MAITRLRSESTKENIAYGLVRRIQASIAIYLHFGSGDLSKYLGREALLILAVRLANHFFHRSVGLAIHSQVVELYLALLIMAPVLQRQPFSSKFDWHRGHLLTHFRRNTNGNVGRFHVSIREMERRYQPDLLVANLESIGIHDADMLAVLMDLYRRHAGGTVLKDQLAHQLFDPIQMLTMRQGFELRHGNRLLRMEKEPFEGSVDLRYQSFTVLDFSIRSAKNSKGRHLEIKISEECLSGFKQQISAIVASSADPEYKLGNIEQRIRDFVERTRFARSALPQIEGLRTWLANKLRGLSGTSKTAKVLPQLLVNHWLHRVDSRLYFKSPTFFLDPLDIDEKTYTTFFSPYREM